VKEEGRGEDCLKKMKSNMGEREEYFRPPHSHACLGFAWMALADIPKSRLISLGLNSECSRYTVEFQNFRTPHRCNIKRVHGKYHITQFKELSSVRIYTAHYRLFRGFWFLLYFFRSS